MTARKRTTKKDTTITNAGVSEVAPHLDPANKDDATIPWTPAWVAEHMAWTTPQLTRVANTEDCCAGLACMHYIRKPVARVIGKDKDGNRLRGTGKAIDVHDAQLFMERLMGC